MEPDSQLHHDRILKLNAARRQTKSAAIAAVIISCIGIFAAVAMKMSDTYFVLREDDIPFAIASSIIVIGLGIGVYFHSRTAAITLFIMYLADQILTMIEVGRPIGIIVAIIVLYYFWNGIRGAFAYHRIKKEENPDRKTSRWWMWLLGAPPTFVILIFIFFAIVVTLPGTPNSLVESGTDLGTTKITQLRDAELIQADEEVLFFYSEALFSILEAGNILTNWRVISYEKTDGELDVYWASFDEILEIEVIEEGDFITDTTLYVYTESGDDFFLLLSAEEDGDQKFIEELLKRIPEGTTEPGITLNGEDVAA